MQGVPLHDVEMQPEHPLHSSLSDTEQLERTHLIASGSSLPEAHAEAAGSGMQRESGHLVSAPGAVDLIRHGRAGPSRAAQNLRERELSWTGEWLFGSSKGDVRRAVAGYSPLKE